MMHMVIAVKASDRDAANAAAPGFGAVETGVDVFGDGQKRIHRTTGAAWYVLCSAQPAMGMQPLRDFCAVNFPTAMIEEFSLEFQPGHQFDILDGWMLDAPPEEGE